MTMETIYAMRDTETGEVRYVGRTATLLQERERKHKHCYKSGKLRFHRWLIENGFRVKSEELERCSYRDAGELERAWIRKFRADGHPVLNDWPYDDGRPWIPHIGKMERAMDSYEQEAAA